MAHDVNQSELDVAAQVRSALVDRISSERYDLWIPEATLWQWNGTSLTLKFATEFSSQLAKRMLQSDLAQVVRDNLGPAAQVAFEAFAAEEQTERLERSAEKKRLAEQNRTVAVRNGAAVRTSDSFVLTAPPELPATSEPLWDRFVRGKANELAWTTANLIVNDPGRLTPVFLYGPTGTGKSLLAEAIAHQLRTVRRMRRVLHMTSEQFTNDFMEGLRGGGLPMFRRKYRDVEALILEDVQFFSGKKSTLTEVKHTLDNLLRTGKQIVFTADRSLNELQSLGSELIGRLRGGLVSPLFPLDETTRQALLEQMLTLAGVRVEAGVVEQLSHRAAGDGRVLAGIAKRLTAVASVAPSGTAPNATLTWDQCWNAVFDLVQATQPVVRIADIERVVCNVFGLEDDSLQSASKMRSVSQPRMLAMFLARKYTPAAYKEIGEYFGRRRHSTVISAEKTVESWLSVNGGMQCGRGMTIRDAIRHVESQLQVG